MVTNVATDSIFLKVTLYSVTIVITLPQKHQYVHLTAYDYSFYSKKVCFLGHLWKPGNQCRQLIINVKLGVNKDYYLSTFRNKKISNYILPHNT